MPRLDAWLVHELRLVSEVKHLTLDIMKSTISSKGQITVPVELREALGLRAGTPVVFELRPEGALIRKGAPDGHPVDRLYGQLKLGAAVDVLLEAMRGPRPRPGSQAARRRRR